jgi:hypothetical protein
MNDTVDAVAFVFASFSAVAPVKLHVVSVGQLETAVAFFELAVRPKYVPRPIPTRPTPPMTMPAIRCPEPE